VSQQLDQALEVLDLSSMLGSFAMSIAEAQVALDLSSVQMAQLMSGRYDALGYDESGKLITAERDTRVNFLGEPSSLLELGFTPTFYHFTETTLEVKISYSMSRQQEQEQSSSQRSESSTSSVKLHGFLGTGGATATTTTNVSTVDARFSSRFSYSIEASSSITTKLTTAPAPSNLMNIINEITEEKTT
jgi:hypothetical protein